MLHVPATVHELGGQPIEQRFVVGQTADKGLKQVGVGVDHTRHHRHQRGVDNGFGPITKFEWGFSITNSGNMVTFY